jgi:hypothetical protein
MRQCQHPGVAVLVNGEEYHVSPDAPGEFFRTRIMSMV